MAAARSPSPMASPGPELLLSPRSRMEARLAAMDSSSEDGESHTAPRRAKRSSPTPTPTRRSPRPMPTQESDDDSEEEIRPRGRMAARMLGNLTTAPTSDAAMPDAAHENDEEDDIIAAPRRLKRREAPEATTPRDQSPAASSSPGLFVSRHQTPAPAEQAGASDSGSDDSMPDLKSSRFAALVKRKRDERLAREAEEEKKRQERMARQADLDILDDSDGNVSSITDDEGGRQLSQMARPTRKAGKKAMEEMNRETQRMARNMQLAHEAKTRKKITKASLFERFNFRTAPAAAAAAAAAPAPEPKTASSSRPGTPNSAHNSDVDMKDDNDTPPSSPPADDSAKDAATTAQPVAAPAQNDEDDLPSLAELLHGAPQKSAKAKGKEIAVNSPPKPTTKAPATKRQFRVKMPEVSVNLVSLDSDEELEVAVAKRTTRIDAVFDKVPEKKTNEAQALHALRLLAQVKSSGKEVRQKKGKPSMTSGELGLMLHQRARQQAKLERERRLEALKAKGIVVQTAEEREKEMQEVEDIVTKARKEAEEIMEREREAAKEERRIKIRNGELDPLAWDDSEDDDDYEGSDEGQDEEDEAEVELSGSEDETDMVDNEAEEADTASGAEQEASGDEQEQTGSDEEAALPKRNARRSKKNAHVISDDEDEEAEIVEATPKPKTTSHVSPVIASNNSPAMPTSVLRSAKKTFIPGLPITGPAGLGLTQIFAGTMDDSQDMPGGASMASPMPTFGGFPNFDEETQPDEDMILDSQSGDTQKVPTQQGAETQGIQLHYTQSQMHGFDSLLRGDDLNSTQVDMDASQDGGLQDYTPLRERFFEAPASTIQTQTQGGDVEESIQDSPLVRRGRLRRKIEDMAEEPEATFASESGVTVDAEVKSSATAFDALKAAAKKAKKLKEFNKKKSKAKDMFEEQADESEDEYAGLGGADGEDSSDDDDAASVKEMIDDEAGKDGDERKIAALYAERERARDEQQVDKLFHDLTTGMLRRKRGADYDLSDSDDGGEARRRLKRRQFAKMQKALFADERIKKIAENPGNQAFMRTIEDRGSDEEMDFLEMGPEPMEVEVEDESQSQGQTVPDSQPANEKAKPLGAAATTNPRRNKEGRKPSNLGEIRESVSSLLEDPNDLLIAATGVDSDSEAEDERPSTAQSNKENTSPGKANPRRTAAPKHAVIDRMSLKRDSSSNLSASTKLAFSSTTAASGFKVPALLRRATTNSLASSTSTSGSATSTSNGLSGGGFGDEGKIRKTASKKSGVSYLARETERRAVIQQHDQRREARKLRGAEKRGKAVGGLFGSGKFE
ncbi:hypothetical protein VDGE_00038 [Verticillium dahliae]|uniref:DNA replication checkpoint mediator MRC1 domain-containing protein n=1 Tax=Verticillium dahliae TaxID=27337 RepID=A0A444S1U5_VERDA|nr:hypothetical protein VDGE_00038 [Verticillium dahliae]